MNERDEQVAIDPARGAGALLRAELGKRRQITFKGTPTNLVTEMDRLAEALIIEAIQAGFPGAAIRSEERGTRGGRRMGSAVLYFCYVAPGRRDGYWELRVGPCDAAAGVIMVEEAGGRVTN